jgi:hypothetical protein
MRQLEEGDFDAAAISLEATYQSLEPVFSYFKKTPLNQISAAPEVLMT